MKTFLPILAAAAVLLGFGASACIRKDNQFYWLSINYLREL